MAGGSGGNYESEPTGGGHRPCAGSETHDDGACDENVQWWTQAQACVRCRDGNERRSETCRGAYDTAGVVGTGGDIERE